MKNLLSIILILSVGINIALLTSEPNNDIVILDIAENSHFVGCARVSVNFDYCKQLSKQYRKELSEYTGLEDRTAKTN